VLAQSLPHHPTLNYAAKADLDDWYLREQADSEDWHLREQADLDDWRVPLRRPG
jgi:hypothetical protein